MLQIGSVLGSYRLTSLLGSGAMGVVYGAQHERSGERAAIKVVGIADEETKLRFEREARALAAIDDPHVVKLLEVGEHRDALYYAMEHLEGHDLGVHMQLHRRMAATDALPYVEQICAGLTAVHARGIVHRDIKPGNVFVCDGLPLSLKLLDFGLARQVNTQHQLTVGGLGTPLFAAPEQVANDGRCDHRADIYALGVVVYRMLSGEMPFDVPETARALAVFMMPLMRDPIPLAQRCPQIDADIARAVDRCLTRDPGQRFDSAAELAASFAAAAHRSRSATLVGVGPAAARAESPRDPRQLAAAAPLDPLQLACADGLCVHVARMLRDEPQHALARAALRSLERGRWALALPDGARDERAALGDRINIARITELPGVYASVALGWPPLSTASGQEARQVLGAPRRVVIDTGSDFAVRDDFAGSVQRALRAAAVWLVGAGLLDPAPRARARLQPLAWPHGLVDGGSVPQQRDGAAGLAAALAYVWGLPGSKPRSAHVGAIARVGPRGRVDGVERFVERLAGLRREAPFVERIYVASSDACAAPPELLEGVELVAVASVAVALDDLFGGLGADIDTSSASHTPKALAARAWQLELELEHDLAAAVAARALDASLSGAQWPQDHRVRAQVTGRSIEAVSLIHRGRAHEALHALDAVEAQLDHVDAALREDILTGAFRAHLVVRRASALIDVLRAGEAAALCEGAADLAAMLPRRQKIELLGTWSRALRAAGQLDRAREIVERQCAIALPSDEPDYLDERPRMLCNRLEVLVALHHSAPGDELAADIEQTLLAARTANSALPDLTSKAQNVRFLDLVEARWSAETADAARAAGLVGAPATTRGLWPEHHVQRFVGEAIARDERLAVEERVDGALARLDEAVGAIPAELQNAAPLLYVVFLSAAARAATIRIRAGRDGWREPASGFMRALSAWAPGAAASAPDGDDASAWVAALEHALDLLPY